MVKKLPKTHYYKVFEDKNLTCQGYKFEFNKLHRIEGELQICENGFHACKELIDCFKYKTFHLSMRVCIVQLGGKIKIENDKAAGETLRIVRELAFWEIDELVNEGKFNLGYGNKGNWNTGDWNTGNLNRGDSNTGNSNKGDWNTGNSNKGDWNTGNSNKGDWNKGDSNKGNSNTGNSNKGNSNKGNSNRGDWNHA